MTEKKLSTDWTRKDAFISGLWFFLHFLILVGIAGVLLLFDKFSYFADYMKDHGANYLYALFCAFLLVVITYFYFLFAYCTFLLKTTYHEGRSIIIICIIIYLLICLPC